jgi:hypothetical protein
MLDFAEFDVNFFFVYCENSNDSRTLIGVLFLSVRDVFSLASK